MDETNRVYLGFIENAPTLCIWDCEVFNAQPTGHQSFVFQTDNLDLTMERLRKKGGHWQRLLGMIGELMKFV